MGSAAAASGVPEEGGGARVMLSQPTPPAPVPCGGCGGPIVETDIGWTHVDADVPSLGWLCPMPYMQLARPGLLDAAERRQPTPIPPRKRAAETAGRHGVVSAPGRARSDLPSPGEPVMDTTTAEGW